MKQTPVYWCCGVLFFWCLAVTAVCAEPGAGLERVTAKPMCAAEVAATGRVIPLFSVRLGCRLSGSITDWGVDGAGHPLDVGMSVIKGQPLFTLEQDTFRVRVTAAEAVVAELEAKLQDKSADEKRYQRLVEVDRTVPVKKLEEVRLDVVMIRQQLKALQANLESARLDLRDTVVRAPFDGVITLRMKGLGDYVSGMPLVEVLELTTADRLEAELKLPESYMTQVVPGKSVVALSSPQLRGALELPVTRVVPAVDAVNGTFVVRVAIPPEKREGLVPGNFVTGRLQLETVSVEVLVPQRAVIRDARGTAVLVPEDGKMVRRAVELGSQLTEGVIVKAGLKPGEAVLSGPADQLKEGAPLPEALKIP